MKLPSIASLAILAAAGGAQARQTYFPILEYTNPAAGPETDTITITDKECHKLSFPATKITYKGWDNDPMKIGPFACFLAADDTCRPDNSYDRVAPTKRVLEKPDSPVQYVKCVAVLVGF